MKDPVCWGIYRELAHSPGRETDDAEILRETAAELSRRGYSVGLKSPDELPETDATDVPPFLFVMCERVPIVERLAEWERRGARIVNRPSSIRNTDRERAVGLFERDGIPFPRSFLVETAPARRPAFSGPCWIKRSDVHATEAGDVAFAAHPAELAAGLATLAARGIARAVVQEHVPGDLVKFYGVAGLGEEDGRPSWFQWFYHRDQTLSGHPLDPDALAAAATRPPRLSGWTSTGATPSSPPADGSRSSTSTRGRASRSSAPSPRRTSRRCSPRVLRG